MIVVQFVVEFTGDDHNHISLNLLEREDANDQERGMAGNIQSIFVSVLGDIKRRLPEGGLTITMIEKSQNS